MRKFIAGLLALCLAGGLAEGVSAAGFYLAVGGGGGSAPGVSVVKIGGGGWLVGEDINATDGQRLVRTDTYGAYLWNSATSTWSQLVNMNSMPPQYAGYYPATGTTQVQQSWGGVYEIASCPSTSADIYMMYSGRIFFSSNHGSTWANTGFASPPQTTGATTASGQTVLQFAATPSFLLNGKTGGRGVFVTDITNPSALPATYVAGGGSGTTATTVQITNATTAIIGPSDQLVFTVPMDQNGTFRMNGRKMAVDPNNCNHVYAGTDLLGMFETKDGGATWTAVSTVPTAEHSSTGSGGWPNYNIAFDPSSGTTGGITNTVYAYGYQASGGAVYVSTNAGVTWTATTGGPTVVQHMVVAPTGGILWAIDGAGQSGTANGSVWEYSAGTWTHPNTTLSYHSIAVDPADSTHIVAGGTGSLSVSANTGSTWTAENTFSRAATDVPWLAWANENSMSPGDMQFDPSGSNLLVFSEGIGVWTTNPPASGALTWTSATAGIEQMVTRYITAPNGYPVVGLSDKATFLLPNYKTAYPSTSATTYSQTVTLINTWGIDYAQGNRNFLAERTGNEVDNTNDYSGTSTDGGATWRPFNSYYQSVTANSSTVTNNGSGLVRLTLPTTTGLHSWTPGQSDRTTLVHVMNLPGNPLTNVLRRDWEITVVDSTHIDLIGSSFTSNLQSGSYDVYSTTGPLSDEDGHYTVTGTSNDGGLIHISVNSTSSSFSNGVLVCLTGVGGTTEANGCWTSVNNGTNSFDLLGSTFVNAWTSGGTAWKNIPVGGAVAVSDANNIILSGGNNDYPKCTTDGGQTWTEIRYPQGLGIGVGTGWVGSANVNAQQYAADRTTTGVFYGYNSSVGTYTITNCGAPTLNAVTIPNSNFNVKVVSVPGYSGHLLLAVGPQGSPPGNNEPGTDTLRWTNNAGASWTAIANTQEPRSVCVGAVAPGSNYPTVYFVGFLNHIYGIYQSTSMAANWAANTVSWTKVADYPNGSMDNSGVCSGDQTAWNKWYVGFGGSSFAYGQ